MGPAARSLLRAPGPSQAAPPSKAPRAWGPEKPSPRPSGSASAAPRPSPYRSPLAAVPELPAAHLALGGPRVEPEGTTPPQAWGAATAAPTAMQPSLVIHPAPESSAFWGATFALLWSESQISRWVGAAGEESGKKPTGGVWGQGFSNGPSRAGSLEHHLQCRVQSPQIRISKGGCGACNLRRSWAQEP